MRVSAETCFLVRGECVGATMWELKGKIALVTGATSGIGRAIAREIAAAGAQLMLTGRNQAAGAALADELGARFTAGDIADPAFPDRLIAETLAAFGALDILINNAGITHRGSILETSDDDWARVMEVNVTALMRWSPARARRSTVLQRGRCCSSPRPWRWITDRRVCASMPCAPAMSRRRCC